MKKSFLPFLLFGSMTAFIITGCSKDDNNVNNPSVDYVKEATTHSDDQARFSEEMEVLDNESLEIIEDNMIAFDGIIGDVDSMRMCGVTVSRDSLNGYKRVIINYTGQNCGGRVRTGTVTLSMLLGQRWADSGAVLKVEIQNLQITRLRDTFTITVNGIKNIKNVTGGRVQQLSMRGNIIHEITSPGMSIAFPNNTTRSWQIAKRRIYNFTQVMGTTITIAGIHTSGSTTGITEWGTDRFGNTFVSSTPVPVVRKQNCNFRITRGEVKHERGANTTVVIFGLDAQGNPVTACPNGPLYMSITSTTPSGTNTVIRPY